MNYSLKQTDREACAIKTCPRDGAVVYLTAGPDVIDLGYLLVTKTDEAVNAFLPASVRADVATLHGAPYRGTASVDHLQEAEAAMQAVPRPPVTPLGTLADVHGAYLSEIEDTALLYAAPAAWIEARTKRALDLAAQRLGDGGSEARRLTYLENATKAALAADAERNRRAVEYAGRPFDGVIPENEYWIGRELPTDGTRLAAPTPHYADPDDVQWTKHVLPAGVPCALRSKPGRLILRAGQAPPEGISNAVFKNTQPIALTVEGWQEVRRALKSARKGTAPAPRPEPTLRYAALGQELVQSYARDLASVAIARGWAHWYIAEAVVRGLRMPPSAAADLIDREVIEALGGKRVYGDPSWDRAGIETACVAAWESTDLAAMPFGALIPAGWVDKIAERAAGLLPRLRDWLTGRDRATSAEIVDAMNAEGEAIDEDDPNAHRAILRAMNDAGYSKKRLRNGGSIRINTFVRDDAPKALPPLENGQTHRWVKSVQDLYPDE